MKARLWQKPSSVRSTNPSTPASPPLTANNTDAVSPPPPSSQQQQPIQTYQNSAFVPPPTQQQQQQQQQQQVPPPPQQYPSHPQQQQQFNQQQPQHAPVYMQATGNTHPNQTSILGNLQAQTNNYRHSIHPSVAPPPPPPQHVPTHQNQHPTAMDHAQVLQQQHFRMSYPNYGANSPFDRATWATPHPQGVQATQQALSFATNAQQANMASYPPSLHQQPQFITANVS